MTWRGVSGWVLRRLLLLVVGRETLGSLARIVGLLLRIGGLLLGVDWLLLEALRRVLWLALRVTRRDLETAWLLVRRGLLVSLRRLGICLGICLRLLGISLGEGLSHGVTAWSLLIRSWVTRCLHRRSHLVAANCRSVGHGLLGLSMGSELCVQEDLTS